MKSTKYIFAAALAVLALGCNKEQVAVDGTPDGEEVAVTFAAELPGTVTKAIGDGLTAKNLIVEVYEDETGAAGTHIAALHQTATFTALKADVKFSLVKGKTYHFIFWAQADNAPYTLDAAAKTVAISYAGEANDEKRDAFYAVKTLKVTGPATEPVQLHRPFAQVNFGTSDSDAATTAGVTPTASLFTATDAASSFDVFAGEGKDPVDVSFTEAALPAEQLTLKDGTQYTYLAMNYFIPTGKLNETHVSNLTATFKGASDDVVISVPSAKVQANYRTNIVGNLLTDQVVFNVEIVPAFEQPDEDIDLQNISKLSALKAFVANGGSAKLVEDIEIDSPLVLTGDVDVTIDLNGHSIVNKTQVNGNYTVVFNVTGSSHLTINGDGEVKALEETSDVDGYRMAIWAYDNAVVDINGGYFYNKQLNPGTSNLIYVMDNAVVNIAGGKFETAMLNAQGTSLLLNIYDAHRATAKINVTGGQFVAFNPADCDSEGPHTNFLAPGYKSVGISGSYFVSKDDAPVSIGVSGQDELDNIVSQIPAGETAEITLADGTYKLPTLSDGTTIIGETGNEVIDCAETTTVSAKNVTISNVTVKGNGAFSNGSSLAASGSNSTITGCTFKNGRQNTYGSDLSVSNGSGSVVTVSNCDFRKSGFRGIMIWNTGDEVKIDNCIFDNTYPFNCDAGTGKITVTDCELNGWTSYTNTVEVVTFTNCKFGKSASGYAYLVPYSKTIVKDCTFSADFLVSPSGSATFTIEFINCKYEDGSAITSSIMDTEPNNSNVTWIIDGVTYNY